MDNPSIAPRPPERAAWLSYLPDAWTKRGPVVPVLRFSGAIGMVTPLRPGLSLSTSASALEKAFSMRGAKAVAIQINTENVVDLHLWLLDSFCFQKIAHRINVNFLRCIDHFWFPR